MLFQKKNKKINLEESFEHLSCGEQSNILSCVLWTTCDSKLKIEAQEKKPHKQRRLENFLKEVNKYFEDRKREAYVIGQLRNN